MRFLALPALAAAALPAVHAWGALGHMTVAYVAQDFVSSTTASWAQGVLGISNSSYLASVATYADSYRYTSEGRWSAPLHFIDANDDPTNGNCNVDYGRDCSGDQCVVAAIANYTGMLQQNSASSSQLQQAMKFLVHFTGDITQPLHDENYEVGANDVSVTYNGSGGNLHAAWDTYMPEQLMGSATLSNARAWANTITSAIQSGAYQSAASSWVQNIDLNDMTTTGTNWASDANAFVCSNVFQPSLDYVENNDLSGSYYSDNIGTIQQQLAKAGYRLAALLNLLNDGSTGL